MRRHVRPALVLIFDALTSVFVFAQAPTFTGKVVGVTDGDTITVLLGKTKHKIRLQGIDTPESGQDFGTRAQQAIAAKIFGKDVKIVWASRDKYQRILGEVYLDGRHINLEMVKEGYAWHF